MAETVVNCSPLIYGVSNPELAAAFGADMITFNGFDFDFPYVMGIDINPDDLRNEQLFIKVIQNNKSNLGYIKKIKEIIGRFIGVNLEPIPDGISYPKGKTFNKENIEKAILWGFDYVVITGNPNTGVTAHTILKAIEVAADIGKGKIMIAAGKMHGAGEVNIYDPKVTGEFVKVGADVVLIPAPGTIPGMDMDSARGHIENIHKHGGLAMTAIGTSQEGAYGSTINQLGLFSKMVGADIQHIGDAGYSGIAPPENIMELSITIRGKRHTYRRMAYSIKKE
jgi:hypothetical protein